MSAGRVSAVLRALSGARDTELIPQARLSGPMPWVIAIMVALTVIALAGGLTLRNTVLSAQHELRGGMTVQIVEAREDSRQAQSRAAIARLQTLPAVRSVRQVPQGEIDQLIEPWLGSVAGSADAAAIPVPSLIDVQLYGEATDRRIAEVRTALASVAPAARVDCAVRLAGAGIQRARIAAMAGAGAGCAVGDGAGCRRADGVADRAGHQSRYD